MQIYFTSDWHFNHLNIIKYCSRPFKSLDEMNNCIISKFNSRVNPEDLVFNLGDFGFKSGTGRGEGEAEKPTMFLNKLNCKNIIFIEGNHDLKGRNGFRTPIQSMTIEHGGKTIYLTHDPKHYNKDIRWNFCGHTHGKYGKFVNLHDKNIIVDLSVEAWNYEPVDINEIFGAYAQWDGKNGKSEHK